MKKLVSVLLALAVLVGMTAAAAADGNGGLNDFASRLKKAAQQASGITPEETAPKAKESEGPEVRINDPLYQKVRSSVFLSETAYSKEAVVLLEVKNVSGTTLYPDDATVTAYNAAGQVIQEEKYCTCAPYMVNDGESVFVREWFFGFEGSLSDIAYFEVQIETDTSSYTEYAKIDAQAYVSNGKVYISLENTLDKDIYGICATAVVENAEGKMLDICNAIVSNDIGISPGSTMLMRKGATNYDDFSDIAEGKATVYALYYAD